MNKVLISGRLVRDAETRTTQSATPMLISKFTLAVDRRFSKENTPTTDFINCVAFGKTAELISKYVSKGSKILVSGQIQTGSYKNKDGNTVYTTNVVAEEIEFLDNKKKSENEMQTSIDNDMGFMPMGDIEEEDSPF